MGTRGVYGFSSNDETYYVYKHWDNYPSGAVDFINKAMEKAWSLPRFEADEFAAAFVVANKGDGGGNVRLSHGPEYHGDIEWYYEIFQAKNGQLIIKAFEMQWDEASINPDFRNKKPYFYGRFKDFVTFVSKHKENA